MIRVGRYLLCGAAAVALCGAAYGLTAENPYQAITDRNVFGLKDPPPPPPPVDLSKPTPSTITLTGVTDILGNKRVLLKTAAVPAKPGQEPTPERSYILTVGQREDEIEVLDIDVVGESVRIRNAGREETLTIKDNGPKIAATPLPTAPGQVPGKPALPIPTRLPGAVVPPPPTGLPTGINPLTRSIPTTRSLRVPNASTATAGGVPSYGSPTSAYNPAATTASGTTGGLNLGSLGNPASTAQLQPKWPPEPNLSLAEQEVIIEAQREAFGPGGPPMPPTSLSGELNQTQTPQEQTQQQYQQPPRPPGFPQF